MYKRQPYRPLLGASNFRQYTLNDFGDTEQERLKEFCDSVNINGGRFMLSNSDSEMEPGAVSYTHLDVYKRQPLPLYRFLEVLKLYCNVKSKARVSLVMFCLSVTSLL